MCLRSNLSAPVAGASKCFQLYLHHFCLVCGVFVTIVHHQSDSTHRWIFRTFCGYAGLFNSLTLVSLCGTQACTATLTITDFVVCAGFDFLFSISFNWISVMESACKEHKHFMC